MQMLKKAADEQAEHKRLVRAAREAREARTYNAEEVAALRKETEQLRKEKEQLRAKELLLLQRQPGARCRVWRRWFA